MKKIRIGFLDSGIGGVIVLKECIKLNPNFEYIYYSDSINNPYGDKKREELIRIVDDIVLKLINRGCMVIVLACNTASSVCVDYLREKYAEINFIAIVPAIKMVCDKGDISNTLVMATCGTINSEKFQELYLKLGMDSCCLLSCSGLANLIEDDDFIGVDNYLSEYLKFYKGRVSSVVLGCTHYPIIKDNIRKILGDVSFYDGSCGVAFQLSRVISDNSYVGDGKCDVLFFDSSDNENKRVRFFNLLGKYK